MLLFVGFVALLALVLAQRAFHLFALRMKRLQSQGQSMLDVVFLHPDLGLGGAERLVVDAAAGLLKHQTKYKKVRVTMVTNFHDKNRCFAETRDGTIDVIVRGSSIPRHIGNKGLVLFATLRMTVAAVLTCVLQPRTDCFVVDQVSAVVPIIKLLCPASSVLFYCHFPDQLCDPSRRNASRRSVLHRMYRTVFDFVEEVTMDFADSVVSNSKFSRGVTVATFKRLASRISEDNDIFYPPIAVDQVTREPPRSTVTEDNPFDNIPEERLLQILREKTVIISLNRYERKKNIGLALEAFAESLRRVDKLTEDTDPLTDDLTLIVAGGYDPRLSENVEHYGELRALAQRLGIDRRVIFLRSISERTKYLLLHHCRCVLYTPSGEHFGIVPIEAMAFGRVVVAVKDGGPLESVTTSEEFGFLCEPNAAEFGEAITKVVMDDDAADCIGRAAKKRCRDVFSIEAFSERLIERILHLRKHVTDKTLKLGQYSIVNKKKK